MDKYEYVDKAAVFREQIWDEELKQYKTICYFAFGTKTVLCEKGDCSTCRIPNFAYLRNGSTI